MKYLVTGGSGFIGSALVESLLKAGEHVLNVDYHTYASNSEDIFLEHERYTSTRLNINQTESLYQCLLDFNPDVVFHLAAESHVDRSIDDPEIFIKSNIVGTFSLLEAVKLYVSQSSSNKALRIIHVSTDEVYGSIQKDSPRKFRLNDAYLPNSPYSASKASSDLLVRAWRQTYGLDATVTNCSNNYGPRQHIEKLIPKVIRCCFYHEKIPMYGDGENIRDWLYVYDHVDALKRIAHTEKLEMKYLIGGNNEISNKDLILSICKICDEYMSLGHRKNSSTLIEKVADRKAHDFKYSIDLGSNPESFKWKPRYDFDESLKKTVKWYLNTLARR